MPKRDRELPTVRELLSYVLNETSELAAEYQIQLTNIESFARWNLPDELGESWIAVRDMGIISQLEESGVLPEECIAIMQEIVQRFDDAFDLPEVQRSYIYSHEAVQRDDFWIVQRQLAKRLLPILNEAIIKTP